MGKSLKVEMPQSEADRLIATAGDTAKEYYQTNGLELPKLVFVPRTGYHIGPIIARSWGLNGGDTFIAAVSKGDDGDFHYGQMPPAEQMKGNNVLVIDGVCKSGKTLQHTVDLLTWAGASVKSLVLMNKPDETSTEYVPDFVGVSDTSDAFYVFPWEREEHMPTPDEPMVSLPGRGHISAAFWGTVLGMHSAINTMMYASHVSQRGQSDGA